MYYFAKQYDLAMTLYDEILAKDPSYAPAREFKGWTYLMQGKIDEAIKIFVALGESTHAVKPFTQLCYAHAIKGDKVKANDYLEKLNEEGNGSCYDYAVIHVGFGNIDVAFEYLNKCFEEKLGSIVFLKISPIWDSLRGHKRFTALLKKLKLN